MMLALHTKGNGVSGLICYQGQLVPFPPGAFPFPDEDPSAEVALSIAFLDWRLERESRA